jgi:menaquinol-cytochrome c reductase iron-sulfur subunit
MTGIQPVQPEPRGSGGESRTTDRRTFHITVVYALWGIITGALTIPAAIYLLFPPRARKQGEWVEAATVDQLKPGAPDEVVFRRNRVDGWKVSSEKASAWVVKAPDGQVTAFAPQCTHLGCGYRWEETKQYFLCPCHTSTFAIDGRVLSGPAPRPLDRYQVKVDSGKVLIGPLQKAV